MTSFQGHEKSVVRLCCALSLFCALNVLAPTAHSQSLPLYTVSPFDDQLRTVDPLTGATLTNATITLPGQPVNSAHGLAKHPVTGQLYAILQISGQSGRELVTLDPTTGVAADIGNTGHSIAGIAFTSNSQSGAVTLFAVAGAGDSTNRDDLFTLDLTTGAATLVQDRTPSSAGEVLAGETMAFDPIDGQLYHPFGSGVPNTDQLFEKINPITLAATNIPLSVDTYSEATALTHWAGNMFLLADLNSNLYVVTGAGKVRLLSRLNHIAKGLLFAGTPPSCPPATNTLFGAAHQGSNGPSLFYQIDSTTAAPTLVGPVGFELVGAMAFNATGTLYGTGERMDGSNTNVLLTINPCTGTGTEVGPTGIEASGFDRVTDMSFRHSDGALFAELLGNAGGELATFNVSTGQATLVGLITNAPGGGNALAFAPNDTLFQADSANLNTIDPATGTATPAATLTFSPPADNFPRINAMDFQPSTGTLFGSVNDGRGGAPENYLGTINTTTGAVTLVSSTQTQAGLDAIAFVPVPPADLAVTKSGAPDPVIEGDNLTYTLSVANNGPSGATGVTLTDALPAAVMFVSATPGQGTCSNAGGTVTCNLGNVAAAAQVTVTIVGRPTGAASLSNTASVTANEADPNPANNSATATGTSLGFTLNNTSGTVTVNAGETGRFTLRVTPGAGGFPNAITFASSNVPATVIGSFNPTSTTLGNSAVDVTFSLATTAPSSVPPRGIPMRYPWPILLLTAWGALLLWMLRKQREQRFRRRATLVPLGALLLLFVTTFLGCGGVVTRGGGTPAGSYDVTVTATSSTATHTSTVTLIVR